MGCNWGIIKSVYISFISEFSKKITSVRQSDVQGPVKATFQILINGLL